MVKTYHRITGRVGGRDGGWGEEQMRKGAEGGREERRLTFVRGFDEGGRGGG